MSKRRRQRHESATARLTDSPFGALGELRATLPAGEAPAQSEKPVPNKAAGVQGAVVQRAVVRYQRKGRGGKEVTLVERLGLDAAALAEWLKHLKRALGCGGVVDGDTLVLQGDQRERIRAALEARGVSRISVS